MPILKRNKSNNKIVKFGINSNNNIKFIKKSKKSKNQKLFKSKKLSKSGNLSKNNAIEIFNFLISDNKIIFNYL